MLKTCNKMECRNCLKSQSDEFDYCPECGAKVIRNRLTFKNLRNDLIERYFDIDNTFLKTFKHLISKPEIVIDGYIQGVRRKYINPISYFAFALTLAGLQIYFVQKFFPTAYDISDITASGQEELSRKSMEFVQEYSGIINMLFIPVYALMARIVFFNIKKYNYTELLVVFLYYGAEVAFITFIPLILLFAFGMNYGQISLNTILAQVIFGAYYVKRLYNLSLKGLVLRTLFFLVVLLVFYIIAVIITTAILIAFDLIPVPAQT